MSTDADFAALLDSEGHGAVGDDIYISPPRQWNPAAGMPLPALFVWLSGGAAPVRNHDAVMHQSRLNVRVRSGADAYQTGLTLARAVWDLLDAQTRGAILPGCVDVLCDTSEPAYLGQADGGPHEWSLIATVLK
jgi:hypothetical protein